MATPGCDTPLFRAHGVTAAAAAVTGSCIRDGIELTFWSRTRTTRAAPSRFFRGVALSNIITFFSFVVKKKKSISVLCYYFLSGVIHLERRYTYTHINSDHHAKFWGKRVQLHYQTDKQWVYFYRIFRKKIILNVSLTTI